MPTDPRVRLDAIRQRLANADAERLREDEHHRRYPTSRWRATTHEYELQKHAPADLAATVSALEAVLDRHEPTVVFDSECIDCAHLKCMRCRTSYPCPPVRAITDALGGVTA